MKVTAYLADFLKNKGIQTVFELQGGMITRILDELYKSGDFNIVSMHHEQAAAFAADAFARITGKPGVALATSGPGATNLITGIGSCYFDSVPAIFITGQVNINEQKGALGTRQLGFQETDIVSIVQPITKAAYAVKSANEFPALLQKAYFISICDRPGPVLIDIPMNIQNAEISEKYLPQKTKDLITSPFHNKHVVPFFNEFISALSLCHKPLVLVGRGVRVAGATKELVKFIEQFNCV